MGGFVCVSKLEKGYLSERKHSIHATLWFEGSKGQDWRLGCSASMTVMLKMSHHGFALMLIHCLVNNTSPVQSSRAGEEGRRAG